MMRIGIYGGTFSPPHNGHLQAARAFMEQMWLDILYVIPTAIPPHKQMDVPVSPTDRMEMCRLAFSGMEGVYVSDMEISRGGKSYTAETLRALKTEDNELYFLTGSDMFLSLPNWREPEAIFKLATIVALTRECEAEVIESLSAAAASYRERFGARTVVLPVEAIEMSSSLVREKCKNGEDCTAWVPASVLAYIEEKGLYR